MTLNARVVIIVFNYL